MFIVKLVELHPLPLVLQNQPMMPEIRDLSEALPELPMDPITGVGVVVSRNRAPTGYEVVSTLNKNMHVREIHPHP